VRLANRGTAIEIAAGKRHNDIIDMRKKAGTRKSMDNNDIVPGFNNEKAEHLEILLQKVDEIPGCIVINLSGWVGENNQQYFLNCIKRIIKSGFNKLIISLSGLKKASAIFNKCLGKVEMVIGYHKGDIVLIDVNTETAKVFDSFARLIAIEQDLQCALDYFRNFPESLQARLKSHDPEGQKRFEKLMAVLQAPDRLEPDDPEDQKRRDEFRALVKQKTGMAASKGYIPEYYDVAWMPKPYVSTRLIVYRQVPSNPGIIAIEYHIAHMLDDIYATYLGELAKSVQRWIEEYIEPVEPGEHFAWTFQRYQYKECMIDGAEIEHFEGGAYHDERRKSRPYLRV